MSTNIGQIVKAKREALGWSQLDLERHTDGKVTQTKISLLEKEKQLNVTIETLRALAKGFGCSVVDLLPEEDKRAGVDPEAGSNTNH